MDQKPQHYDGSLPFNYETANETNSTETVVMTDEMRKSIGGNPYTFNVTE